MNNLHFWKALKSNWSTIQIQAADSHFNSDLLKETLSSQIEQGMLVKEKHYTPYDFLAFADDDDEVDY